MESPPGEGRGMQGEASSALRLLSVGKRDLVAQLFLRRSSPPSSFWLAVREARRRLGIVARAGLPPADSNDWYPAYPERGKFLREGDPGYVEWRKQVSWAATLSTLDGSLGVYNSVLASHPSLSDGMHEFLSACLLFDPPPDDLLTFARIGDVPAGLREEDRQRRDRAVYEASLPIVRIPDPYWVEHLGQQRLAVALGHLAARAKEVYGVDLAGLAVEAVNKAADEVPSWKEVAGSGRDYIEVKPWTHEADARRAIGVLSRKEPRRRMRGRPPTEPLHALQAAVWRDDYDWTEVQIAEGLSAQGCPAAIHEDAYGTPRRSNVARDSVKRGRELRQRINSAE